MSTAPTPDAAASCTPSAEPADLSAPPLDVVLKDVDVQLSEEDAMQQLQSQGVSATAAIRFHRTARGKPPKMLPLMRIVLENSEQRNALLESGATLSGKHCSAGPAHHKADSASARGWHTDGNQQQPRPSHRSKPATAHSSRASSSPTPPSLPPPPTTAAEAVAPLQGMPYDEQLAHKKAAVLEALGALRKDMWRVANSGSARNNHSGPAAPEETSSWPTPWQGLSWLHGMRNGGPPCPVDDVRPSPKRHGYRNKCEFSIGRDAAGEPTVGFLVGKVSGHHTIEDPAGCRLVTDEMKAVVGRVQEVVRASQLSVYDRATLCGFWLQLACRQTFQGRDPPSGGPEPEQRGSESAPSPPQLLLVLSVKASAAPSERVLEAAVGEVTAALRASPLSPPATLSLLLQRDEKQGSSTASGSITPIFGPARVQESLCGLTFGISPSSFFQVNTLGAEGLIALLASQCTLTQDTILLDVCCGTGTIGLAMASKVRKVIGIESCVEAVVDAQQNARLNGIANATFVAAKAESGLSRILEGLSEAEKGHLVAIVDPPRAGLHPAVLKALRECTPLRRLLFVSCHVPGFVSNAVDLCKPIASSAAAVAGAPFAPVRAFPVDLFPDTRHCELVVVLERGTSEGCPTQDELRASEATSTSLVIEDEETDPSSDVASGCAKRLRTV